MGTTRRNYKKWQQEGISPVGLKRKKNESVMNLNSQSKVRSSPSISKILIISLKFSDFQIFLDRKSSYSNVCFGRNRLKHVVVHIIPDLSQSLKSIVANFCRYTFTLSSTSHWLFYALWPITPLLALPIVNSTAKCDQKWIRAIIFSTWGYYATPSREVVDLESSQWCRRKRMSWD